MKKGIALVISVIVFFTFRSLSAINSDTIAAGQQPQVAMDTHGIIRVVYGENDKIFCASSNDNGSTFSPPVLVAQIPNMHLGMSRGPQLTSSANYSIVTAIDKSGNIFCFRLTHTTNKWIATGMVNDKKGSAPEGLMGIATDKKDNFYAVWQDIRTGGNNQVYTASLQASANAWAKNSLAYRSPDGHVCECCKPNIAVNESEVVIMFRNWLNGSRDLYVIKSVDKGKSFGPAQKLGADTWKLNGCPMDGGGIRISASNTIQTTWQRKGEIYYCEPGKPEINVGKGRICSITANSESLALAFQTNDTVKVLTLKSKKPVIIGTGSFLKSVALPYHNIFCVWEQDNKIKFKKV